MKRLAFAFVPLLLVLALALGACGKPQGGGTSSTSSPNTIPMDATNFTVHDITVKAGDTVTFDDSTGGYHVICLGKDMSCNTSATGPQDLKAPGFTITAGQKKEITFTDAGTYDITCTVHPNMNVTVTVQ